MSNTEISTRERSQLLKDFYNSRVDRFFGFLNADTAPISDKEYVVRASISEAIKNIAVKKAHALKDSKNRPYARYEDVNGDVLLIADRGAGCTIYQLQDRQHKKVMELLIDTKHNVTRTMYRKMKDQELQPREIVIKQNEVKKTAWQRITETLTTVVNFLEGKNSPQTV
jgi:hypothetical protein